MCVCVYKMVTIVLFRNSSTCEFLSVQRGANRISRKFFNAWFQGLFQHTQRKVGVPASFQTIKAYQFFLLILINLHFTVDQCGGGASLDFNWFWLRKLVSAQAQIPIPNGSGAPQQKTPDKNLLQYRSSEFSKLTYFFIHKIF